jgi:N-acyl homoserine lactone hydrolase
MQGTHTSRTQVVSIVLTLLVLMLFADAAGQIAPPSRRARPPRSVRLYVFDCGTLHIADTGRFRLKKEEVATSDLSVACFLVTHPKGTLIWDPGAVPDKDWKPTGSPVTHHVVLPDSQERDVTMVKPLLAQLTEVGYLPVDITYLALSHYHYDHTANASSTKKSLICFLRHVVGDWLYCAIRSLERQI